MPRTAKKTAPKTVKKTTAKAPAKPATKIRVEDDRTGIENETLKRAFLDNLFYIQGKFPEVATRNDFYMALAYTVRDRLLHRWLNAQEQYRQKNVKTIGYLSAEFLMGPHLGNNLVNLGIFNKVDKAISELGLDLRELMDQEEEPGLGNGGLGRLAACFLDSMATLDLPAIGYGIRYEFGIFDQEIRDGWQVEITDKWLRYGNPWEIPRIENSVIVNYGGYTKAGYDEKGKYRVRWIPAQKVKGVPYDTPVLGYDTNTAATLRLWKAEACESFDFQTFNRGDYFGAVDEKIVSENISKVLYPNDDQLQGKQLRLEQQYFFVSCSLQDVIHMHLDRGNKLDTLHEKFALQLNDTHPSIAIAEMMRLLIDEHQMPWEKAWKITTKTFGYTNHTLLPEALEKWPVGLFARLLPRHLEIIFEINSRFISDVSKKFPNDNAKLSRMSLIDESGEKYVRMAHLACVGSHAINGVAALHSELLVKDLLRDFNEMWPDKFSNKTNGITPRRWVVLNNQELTALITKHIGNGWIKNLNELKKLEKLAKNKDFRQEWDACKKQVKTNLANYIQRLLDIKVDADSLFDIQVKRIHEYKRQHLNVLHIVTLYNRLKDNPELDITPRTFIFGGKAAPGYYMAKLMIKLVNSVRDIVNNDPDIHDKIKVVFLPDYNVTNSQRVYPAADLSEQISTAGKEASGTGCMKFSMNGALTIGTLDGANIEIRDEVGAENFFLFGLTTQEVYEKKMHGYNPYEIYQSNPELKRCLDMIGTGYFSRNETQLFRPLVDSLIYRDEYMLLADYQSYIDCQVAVGNAYKNRDQWTKMSILNVARIGKFSSDRTIHEYTTEIWDVKPVPVKVAPYNPTTQTHIKLSL